MVCVAMWFRCMHHAATRSPIGMDHEPQSLMTDPVTGAGSRIGRRARPPENQLLGAIPQRKRGLSVRGGLEAVKVNSGDLRHGYSIVIGPIEGRRLDTADRTA